MALDKEKLYDERDKAVSEVDARLANGEITFGERHLLIEKLQRDLIKAIRNLELE